MKKEKTALVLFSVLALLAFAPMVQEHLDFPKVRPLAGVTEPVKMPKLNLKSYAEGHFQRGAEKYVKYHYGYRPITIRLYNQYLWDFYHKTYTKNTVVEGKDGWLYEPWFVEDYYHGGTYSQKKDSLKLSQSLHQEAFRIYQLQNLLASFGTTLIVCQAPGKDLVYSEHLPPDTVSSRPKQLSAREFYDKEFESLGVNHINMEHWFLQMKDTVDFLLFPQKGTHWSNIAAVYAADSIFRYIEGKNGILMPQRVIGEPHIDRIRKPDYDLEELFNLNRPLEKLPQHYAEVTVLPRKDAVKPKMIVIGDSFFWNISLQIPLDSLFSSVSYWYYNNTIYFDKKHKSVKEVNLVEALLDADVVMLMYCSTQLYKMSDGFSKQALRALCYDEKELEEIKMEIVKKIREDSSWMKSVRRRAEKHQIPIDTVLIHEAQNSIERYPELFLPALRDSIPDKLSTIAKQRFHALEISRGIYP